jgi:hypothetical protein
VIVIARLADGVAVGRIQRLLAEHHRRLASDKPFCP